MNRRMVVAAVGSSVAGALCLHLYLARFEHEAVGGAPESVVVVTRDIALGEVVTQGALALRDLPQRYVEERHVAAADLERVLGARLTTELHGGSTLLWSDLDVMQEGRSLAGLVRAGMRAYALPEADVSFDGLLRPGDRVDVLWTAAEGGEASVVLESALVLTVGANLGSDGEGEVRRARAGRVTLSVTSEQAAGLSRYQQRGRLKLLLRNPQDLVVLEAAAKAPAPAQGERALHAEAGRGR
jgi:pilus assembly protein CpaB